MSADSAASPDVASSYRTPLQPLQITQQWQYVDPIHPDLLQDEVLQRCASSGITSLQSYVTWSEIEKQPGVLDFSAYDVLLEKLIKTELKWTPFLILGPYYATPPWFRDSDRSLFARCLEHEIDSGIQSIWNPHLPEQVERFVGFFYEHYKRVPLAGIILGPSGNWGEALYPAQGGFDGTFHCHQGWWSADQFARQAYRRHLESKYGTLDVLNGVWRARQTSFKTIQMPLDLASRFSSPAPSTTRQYLRMFPEGLRHILSPAIRFLTIKRSYFTKAQLMPVGDLSRWLDFVDWYLASMTEWAEFHIKTVRSYFAQTRIMVATGGHGAPMLGADFSEQVRVAAEHGAGTRITNLTDDYNSSFSLSRLVSSASRFYGTYFSTEEADVNSASAVTMRLFDAITSGAEEAYFKGLVGLGSHACSGPRVPKGRLTEGGEIVMRHQPDLRIGTPKTEVAVLFPSTSVAIAPHKLAGFHYVSERLRNLREFDIVDETMIQNGALKLYRFLLLLEGQYIRDKTWSMTNKWVIDGGVLLTSKNHSHRRLDPDGNLAPLLAQNRKALVPAGRGYILFVPGSPFRSRRFLHALAGALRNTGGRFPWRSASGVQSLGVGRYATELSDGRVVRYESRTGQLSITYSCDARLDTCKRV